VSVLAIRSHKRFAVRRPVSLHGEDSKRRGGLMIELCSEGCRISNAESGAFMTDQSVTLDLGEDEQLEGRVRWAHGGVVGIKFERALRSAELGELLQASRAPVDQERRYGT
jgi:hypothetical protein